MISEVNFQNFKNEALKASAGNLHTPAMRSLLAGILGYRCGMRRREVQMLLVKNIHPGKEPIICVRANRYATLKSRKASRRLPLFALLPADELALLMRYWDSKLDQTGSRNTLLFSDPETPLIPLSAGSLFNAITRSFQAMMGEQGPNFRFHHLRHSFANRVFTLLLVADQPDLLMAPPPWVLQLGISQKVAEKLRDHLYILLPQCERHPAGNIAYLMCELMGHLSPKTTFQHYLHVIFWLSQQESNIHLHNRLRLLTLEELAKVCAMPLTVIHSSAYSRWKYDPLQVLRTRMLNIIPKRFIAHNKEINEGQIDLAHIFLNGETGSIFGPSQFMVMVSNSVYAHDKFLRTKNADAFERAMVRHEKNLCLHRTMMVRACNRYRKLYARRVKENNATNGFKLPPRLHTDRKAFWQVMRATEVSLKNDVTRASLVLAADALLERKGTPTVNLGYQQDYHLIPCIARGLQAMGIGTSMMILEIVTNGNEELSPTVKSVKTSMEGMGVQVIRVLTNSRQKIAPEGHVHLRVGQLSSEPLHAVTTVPPKLTVSPGVCQGLNYAAMWVMSVVDLINLHNASSEIHTTE